MNNWCICWFFTYILLGILNCRGLTAQRLYMSFGVKGLMLCWPRCDRIPEKMDLQFQSWILCWNHRHCSVSHFSLQIIRILYLFTRADEFEERVSISFIRKIQETLKERSEPQEQVRVQHLTELYLCCYSRFCMLTGNVGMVQSSKWEAICFWTIQ
jgi:hypothetical protein